METIECFADETVFRNDENGYTVLVVKCGKTRVSAVGVMPPIAPEPFTPTTEMAFSPGKKVIGINRTRPA